MLSLRTLAGAAALTLLPAALLATATPASAAPSCTWSQPASPFPSAQPNTVALDMVEVDGGVLTVYRDGRSYDRYNGSRTDVSVTVARDPRVQPVPTLLTGAAARGAWTGAAARSAGAVVVASALNGSSLQLDRSTDGGATWSTTTVPMTDGGGRLALAADGSTLALAVGSGPVRVLRSTDDGQTWAWSAPVPFAQSFHVSTMEGLDVAVAGDEVVVVGSGSRAWTARSTDGGATFGTPSRLSAEDRIETSPTLASRGRTVVAAYVVQTAGSTYEDRVARSTDGGATFSAPVRVHSSTSEGGPSVAPVARLATTDDGFELHASHGTTQVLSSADGSDWRHTTTVDAMPYEWLVGGGSAVVLPRRAADGSRTHVATAAYQDLRSPAGSDAPVLAKVSVEEPDTSAPAAPSGLVVGRTSSVAGSTDSSLTWRQPADEDARRAVLVRKVGSAPSSPTDGTVLHDAPAQPGSVLHVGEARPPYGVPVHYAAFASDGCGNTSTAGTVEHVWRAKATLELASRTAATAVHGQPTGVTARLRGPADAVVGETVTLSVRRAGTTTWTQVATGTTGENGTVRLTTVLAATSDLRFDHPEGRTVASTGSAGRFSVAPKVTASGGSVAAGRPVVVRGAVAPAHPGQTVTLQRRTSTGGWAAVATARLSSSSAYAATWKGAPKGSHVLRVVRPADADHVVGTSPLVTVRVG